MSASPQTADHTIPSRRKLVIFLGVFLACLMLVALVIIFHVPETKIALLALLIPCGLFIVAVVIFDAFRGELKGFGLTLYYKQRQLMLSRAPSPKARLYAGQDHSEQA